VKLRRKTRLVLERLEDRLTPASFNLFYSGGSLTITQTGPLTGQTAAVPPATPGPNNTLNIIDNSNNAVTDAVPANTIQLTDAGPGGGGTTTNVNTSGVTNVTLNLLSSSAVPPTPETVTYDLVGSAGRPGNLTINLNSGALSFDMNDVTGTGPVQGNLNISAGAGNDSITLASMGVLSVNKSVAIQLGAGTKSIDLGSTTIGDNLSLTSTTAVDTISLGADTGSSFSVAGNVYVSTGVGANTLSVGGPVSTATVTGNLTASGLNFFALAPTAMIGGNVNLNAGIKGITYSFEGGAGAMSIVGGSVYISNSGSLPLATSSVTFNGSIGNNLFVTLGNTAGDTYSQGGSVGGNVIINAGSFGKTISLSPTASVGGNFTANLGNGVTGVNIVSITAGAQVGGNLSVRLGNTTSAAGNLLDLSGAIIGGSVTVFGGSGADTYLSTNSSSPDGETLIGGSVYLNLGAGPNNATISGSVGGPSITYMGGAGNDTVLIDAASYAAIYIDLGVSLTGSTKSVTLGIRPRSFFLNFGVGSGTKTLTYEAGSSATPINYPSTILNG